MCQCWHVLRARERAYFAREHSMSHACLEIMSHHRLMRPTAPGLFGTSWYAGQWLLALLQTLHHRPRRMQHTRFDEEFI